MVQRKWYAVTVGQKPGVYPTWIEAGPKTRNIPGGAIFQSFYSEDEAIRAFKAALARGEVKAYPNAGKDPEEKPSSDSENPPLSPLGVEASLLRAPLNSKMDVGSSGLQTPFSSHAQVANLRQALRDSPATNSRSIPSSAPTEVTQVFAPLYVEDDDRPDSPTVQPSLHFTFTSSSSRAYPGMPGECLVEMDAQETPPRLEVDWDSPHPTPLSSDSHLDAEEHTSKHPRCMPLHPDTPFRSVGRHHRSLTELVDMQSVDSRVWPQNSRIFDPDKVKPRPIARTPSPVKRDISPLSNHETVDSSPQLRHQFSPVHSPLVRIGRGRHLRLTPSISLPILPDQKLEDCRKCPTQVLERPDYSVRNEYPAERPTECSLSSRNTGRSHVQLVSRDGRNKQSVVVVHCPSNCPHETCYRPTLVSSVPAIEPSRLAGPRHVDACVSPIITITSRVQRTDDSTKNRPRNWERDDVYGLAGFTQVSHQGIATEADVRSPISKGAMIPMNAAETPFGRPSPPVRLADLQIS